MKNDDSPFDFGKEEGFDFYTTVDLAHQTLTLESQGENSEKYIVPIEKISCHNQNCAYVVNDDYNFIFFLNKPGLFYKSYTGMSTISENPQGFELKYDTQVRYLGIKGLPNLTFAGCMYKAQIDFNGDVIKKDDNLSIEGIYSIPISVFGTGKNYSYDPSIARSVSSLY